MYYELTAPTHTYLGILMVEIIIHYPQPYLESSLHNLRTVEYLAKVQKEPQEMKKWCHNITCSNK